MFLLLLIDENVVENILGVCDSGAEMCVIRADLVARHFSVVLDLT